MERNEFEIEICAANIQSVLSADKVGANRVELCSNLTEGGTTPSAGIIRSAKELAGLDVFVLIRPRGGHFVYDKIELEIMLGDIRQAVINGADGMVIGALHSNGTVHEEQCARMIEAANGLPVTFHRAFDQCRDPFEALEALERLGIQRVLSSGHQNSAPEGARLLSELNARAKTIKVMAGAGVNETNVVQLAKTTGVRCFHASMGEWFLNSTVYSRREVRFNAVPDGSETAFKVSNSQRIKALIGLLQKA